MDPQKQAMNYQIMPIIIRCNVNAFVRLINRNQNQFTETCNELSDNVLKYPVIALVTDHCYY